MENTRGFHVGYSCRLSNNGFYIRVDVDEPLISLRTIFMSLIDISWVNHFFPKNDWAHNSVLSRAMPTIEGIKKSFDNGDNPTINKDTGEKMVSEISRKTLVDDFGHWAMPIAELFKQKVDGNPGFDFHTVFLESDLLMFGEAKYVKDYTPYGNAMGQISDFIDARKDMKDLLEIRDFMPSEKPLENADAGIKGYVAAFSTNGKPDEYIIDKVLNHESYDKLSQHPLFIAIAVNL